MRTTRLRSLARQLSLLLLCGMLCPVFAVEAPRLLTPSAEAMGVTSPVRLSWSAIPSVQHYDCDVARDAAFKDSVLVDKNVTGSELSLSHLLPGARYYWHVRATPAHVNGNAPWSTTQSFTMSEAMPAAARDGRVVFISSREGKDQLCIMNADGSGVTQLLQTQMPVDPALSPDGRLIAFTVSAGDGYFGTGGLYLMQADGSGRHKVCDVPGRVWCPRFNAAGDTVLFTLWENNWADRHLCTIHIDGTGFRRLPITAGNLEQAAWSADGTTIAVIEQNVTLYAAKDNHKSLTLPNPDHLQHDRGCFSRDGQILICSAFANGAQKLLLDDADGSGETCLTNSEHLLALCVSPDGSTVLFGNNTGVHRISFTGDPGTTISHPGGSWFILGMDWQAAPGRWTPEAPAPLSPADRAEKQPQPVRLAWTTRLGATGYDVQVASDVEFRQLVVEKNQVTGAKAAIDSLKPHTRYYWRVRARCRDDAGAWSPARTFITGAKAAEGFGLLHGTAGYEGGGTIAHTKVTVTIGQRTQSMVTDDKGVFAGVVPVGTGTARMEGAEVPVTIKSDELNTVTLIRKPDTGIVLTVTFPDGTPHSYGLSACVRKPRAEPDILMNPRIIRPGVYWYPDVTADMTEFAVIADLQGSHIHGSALKRWTFAQPATLRQLTMTVPAPVHVRLAIVDDDGKPVANTPVDGLLHFSFRNAFNFWPEMHQGDFYSDAQLKYAAKSPSTDALGLLDLQNMVPNTYDLTLQVGAADGAEMELVVGEDGTYAPRQYTVHTPRQVTQQLFHADGTPAAHEPAYASFCRAGRMVILSGQADAHGKITWTDLPNRRVIVSGPRVAAGVIPAESSEFLTALPTPTPGGMLEFHAEPSVKGTVPVTFGVVVSAGGVTLGVHRFSELHPPVTGEQLNESWSLPTGTPVRIFWGSTFTPLQARLLDDAYLPYADEGVRQLYFPFDTLPFTDFSGVTVKGQLFTPSGAPAKKKTTLHLAPAPGNRLYEIWKTGKLDWLLQPKLQPDGVFTASLPPTGPYELRLGNAVQPAKSFTVTAEKQPEELVVTIP